MVLLCKRLRPLNATHVHRLIVFTYTCMTVRVAGIPPLELPIYSNYPTILYFALQSKTFFYNTLILELIMTYEEGQHKPNELHDKYNIPIK